MIRTCESCALADKIYECCGRHPETGAAVDFVLENNHRVRACPYLGQDGLCRIYDQRPLGCRTHFCFLFDGEAWKIDAWKGPDK